MPYTVKQVSALTGIAPDRLRAWERRYDVVNPARSESRYRLYDDADLARLRMMIQLVNDGVPASLAAAQVRAAHTSTQPLPPTGSPSSAEWAAGSPSPAHGSLAAPDSSAGDSALPSRDALISPARTLDGAEIEQLLDRAFAAGSFEFVIEHWLLPALNALGDGWADGQIDVAGEHFVSAAVHSRLSRAFDAAGTALAGPVVLVGLPPGALHELGPLSFATCLRRLGADVRWLGADLPVDSWAHAVGRLAPAAVVLSVPTAADAPAGSAVIQRLHELYPSLPVFVGGGAAVSDTMQAAVLPDSVAQAARDVAVRLRPTH